MIFHNDTVLKDMNILIYKEFGIDGLVNRIKMLEKRIEELEKRRKPGRPRRAENEERRA